MLPHPSVSVDAAKSKRLIGMRILWIFVLILMLLVPPAWLKFLFGCLVIFLLRYSVPIQKNTLSSWLGILFLFAYLLSPYWLLIGDSKNNGLISGFMPETAARFAAFSIVAGLGLLWAQLGSSRYSFNDVSAPRDRPIDFLWPLLLAAAILLFNLKAFYNIIPIHTDEDHHISRMLIVRSAILPFINKTNPFLLFILAGSMATLIFRPKRIPIIYRITAVPLIVLAVGIFRGLPEWFLKLETICARYPLINAWFHQLGLFWNSNMYQEAHYRIVPMLGTFALGYFVYWILRKNQISSVVSLLAGIAFTLVPVVIYYSTTLYLEIPIVVLLVISMYYLEELLTRDFVHVKAHPAWLALIAAGFFKETLFIMFFTILCLRIVTRGWILWKNSQIQIKSILSEFGVVFCIALPLFFYLVCRTQFADNPRPYDFSYKNLFQLHLWTLAGLSILDQYAFLLILAIIGFFGGLKNKRYLWVVGIGLIFVSHFLFHFMGKSYLVGYARFQLFLLGPLAALALYALVMLAKRKMTYCIIAIVIMLIVNILQCPVDLLTGGKKPGWGARARPYYSDRYYPYREAIQWLKESYPKTPILIGSTHPANMGFRWTCQRFNFQPNARFVKIDKNLYCDHAVSRKTLEHLLAIAQQNKVPLVMFLKTDDCTVIYDDEKTLYGYTAFKIIKNKYQSLVFYRIE